MASVVIVAIGIGLFWGFVEKIKCFFTWKNSALTPVEWDDGPCACKSGTSARWNDRGPTPGTMCCRTKKWVNNWAKGWCVDMLEGDTCLFDDQCNSKYCKPGMTADSKCSPKHPANTVMDWTNGDKCESGSSGLWNDRGAASETRCCPVNGKLNNWGKGWCQEIPIGGQCIFNDQCGSKTCRPEISADGICVNTDFNKACSEHNQCKSEWCHAGKCK